MFTEYLPRVRENVPLKNYTTFQIGGAARYFFVAKTKEDIQQALQAAKKFRLPTFILAGGSNLLISERGFSGLVIKIENCKLKIENLQVYAEAGVDLPLLVKETGKLGLAGLEWAGGLPGSVGGAVRGNAGAFRGEIKDVIEEVEAIDEEGNTRIFTREQCEFSYRSSVFKQKNMIVVSARFHLAKGDKRMIQRIAREHVTYRQERHPLEYPNAGSIFKNCDLEIFSAKMKEDMKDVVKVDPFPVVPTAYLIASAELKGMRVGDAEVSEKHPNYIVNYGNASSQDVITLIKQVKERIREKFGIELEKEITILS